MPAAAAACLSRPLFTLAFVCNYFLLPQRSGCTQGCLCTHHIVVCVFDQDTSVCFAKQ